LKKKLLSFKMCYEKKGQRHERLIHKPKRPAGMAKKDRCTAAVSIIFGGTAAITFQQPSNRC
jgi:hypothetical protein